jgi:hypothetical protein
VDYEETLVATKKLVTIRLVLAMTVHSHWKGCQMDVKSTFLNSDLEEEVYMYQREVYMYQRQGFHTKERASSVKDDKISLWFEFCETSSKSPGYKYWQTSPKRSRLRISSFDPNLYVKTRSTCDNLEILVVYVDGIIIGNEVIATQKVKNDLSTAFDMNDLVLLHYCLGGELWQINGCMFVSQIKYDKSLLEKFRIANCKAESTSMKVELDYQQHLTLD